MKFIITDKDSTKKRTLNGSRKLDSYLINSWSKGTFKSNEASIDYHFDKHGVKELGLVNIKTYCKQAYKYKKDFPKNGGYVPKGNHDVWKYKWKDDNRYRILTKNNSKGKIVSFGPIDV